MEGIEQENTHKEKGEKDGGGGGDLGGKSICILGASFTGYQEAALNPSTYVPLGGRYM